MTNDRFDSDLSFTPWWWEAAPPRPPAQVQLPSDAEVAVIGSGYTGLTASLTLARAGRAVVVLEAGASEFGASTRNGGQVGSGNHKLRVAELVRIHGERKARALLDEGQAMLHYIADLIEREKIDCHFSRVGRFCGAVAPAHYEAMARNLEALRAFAGVEFFMVPRSEQHAEIGTDLYHGGSVLPNDAALHPALFHRGLLQRAEAAGVLVVPFTAATDMARGGKGVEILTSRGTLSAREVVVATNGYRDAALPYLERRVVPIRSAMLATEELAPELMGRLIPKGRIVGNTARVLHYYRSSPDGRRVLFGGRVAHRRLIEDASAFRHLHRDMIRLFPELSEAKVTHCWSGHIGYTHDTLPHLGCRDGIHYATGYCGTGVSRAVYFGCKIALKLLGDAAGETAFDDLPFPRFPLGALTRHAVPLGVGWHRMRDWLDRRR